MTITLHSTTKIVELETPTGSIPARVWEGQTESGIPIHAYVTRLAVDKEHETDEFKRELKEHRAPSAAIQVIPLRMII